MYNPDKSESPEDIVKRKVRTALEAVGSFSREQGAPDVKENAEYIGLVARQLGLPREEARVALAQIVDELLPEFE